MPCISVVSLTLLFISWSCVQSSSVEDGPRYASPPRSSFSSFRTVEDTPSWANWTWYSWESGPPCPQDYRDIPAVELQADGPVSVALKHISALQKDFIAEFKLYYGLDVGISLGIVYNGDIIFSEGAGTVAKNSDTVPDGDTIWNIGSVTKIFTNFLLMKAVDEGVVSFTDPVTKFFNEENPPVFKPNNPYGDNLDGVCMHSLATHTSGLNREAPCYSYNTCGYNETTIFDYINSMNLLFPPFVQPHYSNLGVSLLGRSLERAYGGTYEDLLVDKILVPLGMTSSGFNYTTDVISKMATGYCVNSLGRQYESPYNTVTWGFSAPCGAMYSSVNDLLTFMSNTVLDNGDSPVSMDRVHEYRLPGVMMPDGQSSYGFGTFENVFANGFNTLTKGGLTEGFGTSIAFIPELHLGLAAVINLNSGCVGTLAAESMMIILPALLSEISDNQASPELPEGYETWLGKYGANLLNVYFTLQESGVENVLNATLFGTAQTVTWDQVQQEASGYNAAFRLVNSDALTESCHDLYAVSKDAVAFFHYVDGIPTVSVPDQSLWEIPKIS